MRFPKYRKADRRFYNKTEVGAVKDQLVRASVREAEVTESMIRGVSYSIFELRTYSEVPTVYILQGKAMNGKVRRPTYSVTKLSRAERKGQ